MEISIVVAQGLGREIGLNNNLPWHIPADLTYFKNKVAYHHVLMGRKSYESFGGLLPNCTNLVLTRDKAYQAQHKGIYLLQTFEKAIDFSKKKGESELFILGGQGIYTMALPLATTIYLTQVQSYFKADTFFPTLSKTWKITQANHHKADKENSHDYSFLVLKKS